MDKANESNKTNNTNDKQLNTQTPTRNFPLFPLAINILSKKHILISHGANITAVDNAKRIGLDKKNRELDASIFNFASNLLGLPNNAYSMQVKFNALYPK